MPVEVAHMRTRAFGKITLAVLLAVGFLVGAAEPSEAAAGVAVLR